MIAPNTSSRQGRDASVTYQELGGVRMIRRIALSLIPGLLIATAAWAQLASQSALVGTVTDAGGLAVPGAAGVAPNLGPTDTYSAVTNSEGHYQIQFVRPGKYEITISVTGFSTFTTPGGELATNQGNGATATLPGG